MAGLALAVRQSLCMMSAMSDWNFLTVLVVLTLFALWNLEFVATLLNLKAFPETVPEELSDVMDVSKLDQARAYLQINSGFNMMQACCALSMLLVFWCMNGFSLIDEWARTLPIGNVTVGLVFLSVMFAGQSLLALPFSIYDTFVIEKRFGFNRATPAALRVWLDYSHPPLSERLRALVKCMPS